MPYLTDMFHEQNRHRTGAGASPPDGIAAQNERQEPPDNAANAVAARLRSRVLGQDRAVEAVVRATVLASAGAHDPDRPLANLLLVGPTGVGKTELVRRVAAELRSGPDDLCRVDMSALAQEHYAASFSGAPPGYAGSKEGISVFDRSTVEGDPYRPGIVLFDEVEKAHPAVLRALLHVLDTGVLRLANGRETISFRNSFVFLTSNLGSAELARRRANRWRRVLPRSERAVLSRALTEFFDPEFLNRIDEIVEFAEIDPDTAVEVTRLEVELLRRRMRGRGVRLDVDDTTVQLLARRGFDPVYGARALRRHLRTELAAPVAAELVRVRRGGTDPVHITVRVAGGRITASAVRPEDDR
ncbi:C-terminal, D2-small domain-containing protein, of ClpB protein [Amycolatopsis marina]|uniref:C-terminal, D2-small domain-containing protein, of ClpB protein n=1 Tax=Amycolatopsis marina TaxID=490629 RepID=A0A1I1B0G6_9PSEU|nr:AAA family ATPase [Amycolatopsis marina]SFB43845.1 C-terminal, D2-small domain-containing protein, of ClpB protein [Amycolatopsis marina]